MDKFSFFILNVFINGFLSFFTAAILVEVVLFLFRIKQGRWAASLRTLPLFKLIVDFFLYDFSRWAYTQGINPLFSEKGTRILSISIGYPTSSIIQFTTSENATFTLADLVAHFIPTPYLHTLALLILFFSLLLIFKKCTAYMCSFKKLKSLAQDSYPIKRKVLNTSLKAALIKSRSKILNPANNTFSPFVAGLISPTVYIPNTLNLSQQEYEAVLAHEVGHIHYKDNLIRLILETIRTLFWWIPAKWLSNLIEEGQEIGCDLNCKKYRIDPIHLAHAISKSAHRFVFPSPLVHSLTKHSIYKRLYALFSHTSHTKRRFVICLLGTGMAISAILFGKFWIF